MSAYLIHSAKGTQWKKHKYVKKVDGKYYYSGDYGLGFQRDNRKAAEEQGIYSELKDRYAKLFASEVTNHKGIEAMMNTHISAIRNDYFGGGGMPSDVASRLRKDADYNLAVVSMINDYESEKRKKQ